MKAYRCKTKISNSGNIKIPINPSLYNTRVEIIILPEENHPDNKISAKEFIETWAGFMKNPDTDNMKYEYLSEKYK